MEPAWMLTWLRADMLFNSISMAQMSPAFQ